MQARRVEPNSLPLRAVRRLVPSPRKGSSWPVLVETDAGRFIVKLAGTGHGHAALVAEVIVAELAERLGLQVPARVLVPVEPSLVDPRSDPELQDLLGRSLGLGLGFAWLEGARDLEPGDLDHVSPDEAAAVMWLDGLVGNPDRTWRSPNLMIRRGRLYLVDHGACLPFHHDWRRVREDTPRLPGPGPALHALAARGLPRLAHGDRDLAARLGREELRAAVATVPDDFLRPLLPAPGDSALLARRREAYVAFLWKRLRHPRPFVSRE